MLKKGVMWFFLIMCIAVGLCACGQNSKKSTKTIEGLDELGSIKVVSREEGSGTRTTFADLTGLGAMSNSSDNSDETTKDAYIADNADKVTAYVSEHRNAIGYVPVGAAAQSDQVKQISVEGIKADQTSVSKGKYPMARAFYLTYTGKLREIEQDFIRYIEGKGQAVVGRNFVPVAKASTFLSNGAKGKIVIHGSTSMSELMKELAKAYMKLNKNAKITVEASDSTSGLNDAMKGKCDLGMSSRELKDYEKELLNYETIAKDGIAVIVNKENNLEDVTMGQLKDIYKGSMTKWEDLNP